MVVRSKACLQKDRYASTYQQEVVVLWFSAQILENALGQELLHQIPVFDYAVSNRILNVTLAGRPQTPNLHGIVCGTRRQRLVSYVEVEVRNLALNLKGPPVCSTNVSYLSDVVPHSNRGRHDHLRL